MANHYDFGITILVRRSSVSLSIGNSYLNEKTMFEVLFYELNVTWPIVSTISSSIRLCSVISVVVSALESTIIEFILCSE